MADDADEVLELDEVQEVTEDDGPEGDDAEEQDGEEPKGETFIGFEGEEAAPASDEESSVIRELRRKLRDKDRELSDFRRGAQPERIEVGEKPTLESCDYDEERFEADLDAWKDRKAKADERERQVQQRRQVQEEAERSLRAGYEADKAKLGIEDFDEREGEVFAALPPDYDKLLLHSGKAAELIIALSNSPAKLEALSKTTPLEAAMMVGELRSKLQMRTRQAPQPDRPVRGNAPPANADKELARLEKEADRTGDRTALINYKRKLRDRA